MWIKKIHIDDFGKFSNYDLELDPSFTILHGHNEDGKSTLMAFIQMMFYGYSGRSQDLSQNPRKKYSPWNGRDMKGYILFENHGTQYRLERHFGKSNTSDTLTVWNLDTGKEEKMPARKDPGEVFFGLGAEAFERSVFIGQSGSIIESKGKKDEITEKLLNMVTTGDENTSYQKVSDLLTLHQEQLVSRSRKIGIIDKLTEKIRVLEDEKYEAMDQEEEKKMGLHQIEKLKEEREQLEQEKKRKDAILQLEQVFQRKKELEKYLLRKREIEDLEKEIKDLKSSLERDEVVLDEAYLEKVEQLRQETISLFQSLTGTKERHEGLKKRKEEWLENPPMEIKDQVVESLKASDQRLKELVKNQGVLEEKIEVLSRYLREVEQKEQLEKEAQAAHLALEEIKDALGKESLLFEEMQEKLNVMVREKDEKREILRNLEKSQYQGELSLEAKKKEKETSAARNRKIIEEINEEIHEVKKVSSEKTHVAKKKPSPLVLGAGVLLILIGILLGIVLEPYYYGLSALGLGIILYSLLKKEDVSTGVEITDPNHVKSLEEKRIRTEEEDKKDDLRITKEIESLEADLREINSKLEDLTGKIEKLESEILEFQGLKDTKRKLVEELKINEGSKNSHVLNFNQRISERIEAIKAYPISGDLDTKNALDNDLKEIKSEIKKVQEEIQQSLNSVQAESLEDLMSKKYTYDHFLENLHSLENELESEHNLLIIRTKEYEEKESDLLRMASYFMSVEDTQNVPQMMKTLREQRGTLSHLITKLQYKESELSEEESRLSPEEIEDMIHQINLKLDHLQEDEKTENLDPEQFLNLKNQVKAMQEEIYTLGNKITQKESTLREKYREKKNISQIENEIYELKNQQKDLTQEYDALVLASQVLGEAFEEIQRSFGPRLNETTAKIFSKLTKGKYQKLQVNRDFDIIVEDEEEQSLREWKFLSGGTMDQVYLALRLSVATLLKEEKENLPLFLDDIFMQYDDTRAFEALSFLHDYQKEDDGYQQIILFTCHERIVNWARDDFEEISLQKVMS